MFCFKANKAVGLPTIMGVVFLSVLLVLMISRNWPSPIFGTGKGLYSQARNIAPVIDKEFAVLSCSLPRQNNYNYAFYLPLTALAWRRIGFESVVILVGREQSWLDTPLLKHIVKSLDYLNATTLFLDAPAHNEIMVSQVSRLFVSSFHSFNDEDYLLTADSEMWPFHRGLYLLPAGKNILSLNSECCGSFKWKETTYQMLAMPNIGASAATWRQIMASGDSSLPKDTTGIIQYLHEAFGDVANQTVKKGNNFGWYMDQRIVSIRVVQWLEDHGKQAGHFVPRNIGRDRIDRSRWQVSSMDFKNDSHLLVNGHKLETWNRIRPLIVQMYGEKSVEYHWCEEYAAVFRKLAGIDHA